MEIPTADNLSIFRIEDIREDAPAGEPTVCIYLMKLCPNTFLHILLL
jgi:hypothetical protein